MVAVRDLHQHMGERQPEEEQGQYKARRERPRAEAEPEGPEIRQKDADLKGSMASEGTTPRRYTDLLGSLCDLTSGSGDKGTPVVLVQGYFDNYVSE